MKRPSKSKKIDVKLKLSREVLRRLDAGELKRVAGAVGASDPPSACQGTSVVGGEADGECEH